MENVTDLERAYSWRIGVFDIETTDLDGYFGELICIVIKRLGHEDFVEFRIDNYKNEKALLKAVVKYLDSFDMLVGWNSSGFDFPFLNTRCLIHSLKVPARKYRRDLMFVSRGNIRLSSHSLKNVGLKLLGHTSKTRTTPEIKRGVVKRDRKSIDFVVNHCYRDVKDTEKIYLKLMPLLGKPKIK